VRRARTMVEPWKVRSMWETRRSPEMHHLLEKEDPYRFNVIFRCFALFAAHDLATAPVMGIPAASSQMDHDNRGFAAATTEVRASRSLE